MKRSIRLAAILTAMIMVLSMIFCAFAEEEDPLYVSPEFKIPKNRIASEPWPGDTEGENAALNSEDESSEEEDASEKEKDLKMSKADQTEKKERTEDEKEKDKVPKKVRIYSSRKNVVTEGEQIYLTSYLEGFEGLTVTFQWQRDRGNGWEDIPGATSDSYSFTATEETILYSWRVIVSYEAR